MSNKAVDRDRRDEPEKQHHRQKARGSSADQATPDGKGPASHLDFSFEPPIEKHIALLAAADSDDLRADLATQLQQSYGNAYVRRVIERIQAETGSGKPMEPQVRGQMESAFKQGFGDVRVHADASAHELATELGAKAFTSGKDVFFKEGSYAPEDAQGKELLAHELTHVLQQKGATRVGESSVGQPDDAWEREAISVGREVGERPVQGASIPLQASLSPHVLQGNFLSKLWKRVKQFFGHKINPKESKEVLESVFKGRKINTAGVTFQDKATFESEYDKKYGEGKYKEEGPLEGYRDPATNEVFINKGEWVIDTAVHEILHNNSKPDVKREMGVNFNEGITEYLTQKAVSEVGYKPSSSYPDQLAVVRKLAKTVGDSTIEGAYFDGDVAGLKTKLNKAKNDDTTFDKAVDAMKNDDYATASGLVG